MIMVLELLQRSALMPCNPTKVKKQLKGLGYLAATVWAYPTSDYSMMVAN